MRWSYRLTQAEQDYIENMARKSIEGGRARQRAGVGRGERWGGHKRAATELTRKADGYAAELAVARMLGDATWMPKPTGRRWVSRPDAGGKVEVRQTHRPRGRLILHPDDPDRAPFVLVIGTRDSELRAVGWIRALAGKVPEHWDTSVPDPAFFVPQHALAPMEELPGAPPPPPPPKQPRPTFGTKLCTRCKGSGKKSPRSEEPCPRCAGSGFEPT